MKLLMKLLKSHKFLNRRFYHELQDLNLGSADVVVDLRSDTVTKPSNGMREAIRNAIVGDDVHGEDVTVIELEKRMAEISGKEAGLFVASGTMGNLLSILSHCSRRGAEVLLSDESHIFHSEQANIVQFGGVQPYIVPTQKDGTFLLDDLRSRIRSDNPHYPSTELICLENTQCGIGGKALPLSWLDEVSAFGAEHNLPIHVDGARLFNASIATGESMERILRGINSASICFSKNLGAPVGSVIVGDQHFIQRARRLRKGLGGGWRQAGVLAAACLYALDHNVDKLIEDHNNAKLIAKGINDLQNPHIYINTEDLQSNMIFLHVDPEVISTDDLSQKLLEVSDEERKALGRTTSVLSYPYKSSIIRMVTHLDISRQDTEAAVAKMQYVIQNLSSK